VPVATVFAAWTRAFNNMPYNTRWKAVTEVVYRFLYDITAIWTCYKLG